MIHFAKPDQIASLAAHPEARKTTGESGQEYLNVPENVIDPDAKMHFCPVRQEMRFRDILVVEVSQDGIVYNTPYDE